MKSLFKSTAVAIAVLAGLAGGQVANAASGVTFLIGSDVVGLHGDTSYNNPFVDQMANFGSKKLLFVGDKIAINYTNANVAITFIDATTWNAGTSLAPYSGVYFDSPGTCCSDPGPTLVAGTAASIASFVAGGGSLGVGDYSGDGFWDSILGFTGGPGVTTGVGGAICEDPGVSTPGGLLFGFNASYTEGCFVHQAYNPAFWAAKGYFALQTDGAVGSSFNGDWVTMATGFANPAPEPGSIALVGLALAAGAAGLKRRKA